MKTREYIGAIFTDVAALVVGDPCKMLVDSRGGKTRTYDELTEAKHSGSRGDRDPTAPVALGDDTICVPTVESCDGWCAVYIERGKDGWPRRLIVDLNAVPKSALPTR